MPFVIIDVKNDEKLFFIDRRTFSIEVCLSTFCLRAIFFVNGHFFYIFATFVHVKSI